MTDLTTRYIETAKRFPDDFAAIQTNYAQAGESIRDLCDEAEALRSAGMYYYAAEPTELWETRNGQEQKYLRLRFHSIKTWRVPPDVDKSNDFDGPEGKRQIYIGKDPEKIAEAGAMIARRRRYLEIQKELKDLDNWQRSFARSLASLVTESTRPTTSRPHRRRF